MIDPKAAGGLNYFGVKHPKHSLSVKCTYLLSNVLLLSTTLLNNLEL